MRRNAFSKPGDITNIAGVIDNSLPMANSQRSPSLPNTIEQESPRISNRQLSLDRMMANIEGLTSQQINAFKEVFDLFDSNGGGTIDAEELDQALRSVDIKLTKDEIVEVLESMDKDGNGEIDFEEFLQLMTNTERFLESITCRDMKMTKQKEVLLFEALTAFMKKSALHSINEIVGYYHSKYKRVQAPHVVGHYAAGARLIGLTERQIKRHMDRLREINTDTSSPYAQPLLRSFYSLNDDRRNKRNLLHKVVKKATAVAAVVPAVEEPVADDISASVQEHKANGRIRLRILTFNEAGKNKQECMNNRNFDTRHHIKAALGTTIERVKRPPKQNGWMAQRIRPAEVQLPSLDKEIVGIVRAGKTSPGKLIDILNFDDMRTIRKQVGNLTRNYYTQIQEEKRTAADEHWHALDAGKTTSPILRRSFHKAFVAYTNYHTTPVSSLTF